MIDIVNTAFSCCEAIAAGAFVLLLIALYCCIHASTSYDKQINDEQQIKFLRFFSAPH